MTLSKHEKNDRLKTFSRFQTFNENEPHLFGSDFVGRFPQSSSFQTKHDQRRHEGGPEDH